MNDKIIIRSGKAVVAKDSPTALPIGVEFEQLVRNMENHVEQKYDITDLRNKKKYPLEMIEKDNVIEKIDKSTFILVPGMAIEYENSQSSTPPYPTEGPGSMTGGPTWSDY